MRKTISLISCAILLLGGTNYAQQKALQLNWSTQQEGKDTAWFFSITERHDALISQLVGSMKTPATHSDLGMYTWTQISIPGVGSALTLKLKDGMLVRDRSNATSCWKPFDTEKNKSVALQRTDLDQMRLTEIEILDAAGKMYCIRLNLVPQRKHTCSSYSNCNRLSSPILYIPVKGSRH